MLLLAPTAKFFAEDDDEPHDEGQASEDQAPIADSLIVIVEWVHIPLGVTTQVPPVHGVAGCVLSGREL